MMSPPSRPDNEMSTGGLFPHIIITRHHPSRAAAPGRRRVFASAAADELNITSQLVYFASSGGRPNER